MCSGKILSKKKRSFSMMVQCLCIFILMILAAIPLFAAPQTVTLQNGVNGYSGIEDTTLDYWSQDSNFSSLGILRTYGNSYRKILVRINLGSNIPKNASVVSAQLYLYASSGGSNALMYAYDVSKPWVASQATWKSYATGLTWSSAGMASGSDYNVMPFSVYGIAKTSDWTNWDVSGLAQQCIRSGTNTVSLVICNPSVTLNSGEIDFNSSEATSISLRPKLVITYDPNSPIASAGADQSITTGTLTNAVTLNGNSSSDSSTPFGSLQFSWSFLSKPPDSVLTDSAITPQSALGSQGGAAPKFTPDAYGTYVVQVKVTNTAGSSDQDSTNISVINTIGAHPRLFLAPDRIKRILGYASANTYEWQHTLKYAGGSTYDALQQYIKAKGLIYVLKNVTNYTNYGSAVVTQVMNRVASPMNDPMYSTYGVESVALGYDWCHDLFTDAQRLQIIAWINHEADYLKTHYYGGGCWSNYYIRGMYANALAGYATYGENTEAQSHLDEANKRWVSIRNGFLLSGPGGGWAEGTGYGGYQVVNLIQYIELVRSAIGVDLYDSTPFLRDRLRYSYFSNHPGFVMSGYSSNYAPYARQVIRYGDGRRGVWGNTLDLRVADDMLIDYYYGKDPVAKELLWFNSQAPGNHITLDEYMVDELMYSDNSRTGTPPTILSHYAPGVGEVLIRSDWDTGEKATWISLKSMGIYEGHNHLDANSFTIWRQGDLAIDSGNMDNNIGANWSVNYDKRTVAHNTILVYDPNEKFPGFYQGQVGINDGGQRTVYPSAMVGSVELWQAYPNVFNTSHIIRYTDNSTFCYAMGNATNAYNTASYTIPGDSPKLTNFTRQLVYLRPITLGGDDSVIVFDRISSTNANFQKKWLLHTLTEPTVNGTQTTIDSHEYIYNGDTYSVLAGHNGTTGDGDGKLFGQVLLPKAHQIRKIGGQAKVTSITYNSANTGTGKLLSVGIAACNVAQTWTLTFTSATTFTLTGSVSGAQGTGNTTSKWYSNNLQIYFESGRFSGTFAVGDIVYFTVDQGKDFWVFGTNNSPPASQEPKYGSWRIEVEPTIPSQDDLFLNVLFPTVSSRTSVTGATLVEASTGNMTGAQVGDKVILFSRTEESLNEPITYAVSGVGTSRQIMMDMIPNLSYALNIGGQVRTAMSSDQGVLTFDAALNGATQIQINPGSTPTATPANITINKVSDKGQAGPGEVINYTISYINTGGSNAMQVVITDNLPTNVTLVSGSVKLNAATISPDPINNGVLTISVGSLKPNEGGMISYQVKVK